MIVLLAKFVLILQKFNLIAFGYAIKIWLLWLKGQNCEGAKTNQEHLQQTVHASVATNISFQFTAS